MTQSPVQTWTVRTPEGVSFSFRLASPALRVVALAVDVAVVSAAYSVISIVIGVFGLVAQDVAQAVAVIVYFVLSQGYRMVAEWRWRGQTIGKRLMRLRVVDDRGLRLTFAQVALRNILRFVDALPAAYLVGGLAALANRRSQRLGDLAAGTLVIWEPREAEPDFSRLRGEKHNSLRSHPPVVARLRQAIGPQEARVAWQALARRDQLEPEARLRLFRRLADHFRKVATLPPEATEGISDEQLVRNVVDVLYLSVARRGPSVPRAPGHA